MEFHKVKFYTENGVATISFNDPKTYNAIDDDMADELLQVLDVIEADETVKVILLKSELEKAFSSGGNLRAIKAGLDNNDLDLEGLAKKVGQIVHQLKKSSKAVIASVSGVAAGAGANIALAADIIIASEEAYFYQAFVNLGLIPDTGGLYTLMKVMGPHKAMELAMTGRTFPVTEAHQLGIVSKVVPLEELAEETAKLTKQLATGPSDAYAEMKRMVYKWFYSDFSDYCREEAEVIGQLSHSENFTEGVNAFSEKRKPNFK